MTAGPFRPVRLEVSLAHIEFAKVDYDITDDLKSVAGKVLVDVKGPADEVVLSLQHGGKEVFSASSAVASQGTAAVDFKLGRTPFPTVTP